MLNSTDLGLTTVTTIYAVSREQEACIAASRLTLLLQQCHDCLQLCNSVGENVLKNTGLGYTVIRAGPLLEEPGGYKALIFDQVTAIMPSKTAQHNMQQYEHSMDMHNV